MARRSSTATRDFALQSVRTMRTGRARGVPAEDRRDRRRAADEETAMADQAGVAGQFSRFLDRDAIGTDGERIGKVVNVYVDDATGQPEWLAVKTGWFGSSVSFVPLAGATP